MDLGTAEGMSEGGRLHRKGHLLDSSIQYTVLGLDNLWKILNQTGEGSSVKGDDHVHSIHTDNIADLGSNPLFGLVQGRDRELTAVQQAHEA